MPVRVKKTRQHKPVPVLIASEPQPAPDGLTSGDGANDAGASGGDANGDGASPHDADANGHASAPARALPDQHRPASLPLIRHFRYARPEDPASQRPAPAEQQSHVQQATPG